MKLIIISTLMLVLISIFIVEGQRDITVGPGGDYSKIQDAIDAPDTEDGDIIWVMSGVYYENIDINKAVSLEGWNTGSGYPTVDAGNGGSAITLSANDITLEGFKVRNSNEAGVDVKSSDNRIVDIRANNNKYGIRLQSSSGGNYIRSSNVGSTTVSGNDYGIYLDSSNYNILHHIKASGNDYGIYLKSSMGNEISGSNLVNNNVTDAYDDSTDENGNYWGGNGGNHYSKYDDSVEGCEISGSDGTCGAPYIIPGGSNQDYNPLNRANKINIPDRKDKEHASPPKSK
jgi:nitrous oxidase accessory protein NosD